MHDIFRKGIAANISHRVGELSDGGIIWARHAPVEMPRYRPLDHLNVRTLASIQPDLFRRQSVFIAKWCVNIPIFHISLAYQIVPFSKADHFWTTVISSLLPVELLLHSKAHRPTCHKPSVSGFTYAAHISRMSTRNRSGCRLSNNGIRSTHSHLPACDSERVPCPTQVTRCILGGCECLSKDTWFQTTSREKGSSGVLFTWLSSCMKFNAQSGGCIGQSSEKWAVYWDALTATYPDNGFWT